LPDGLFSNQKIPIWVNFGGPYLDGKMSIKLMAIWNFLQTFGIVYDVLFILCLFGTFVRYLVSCTRKNLATLFKCFCEGKREMCSSGRNQKLTWKAKRRCKQQKVEAFAEFVGHKHG
jgi:hypothetical protein